jgi:plastocyanin
MRSLMVLAAAFGVASCESSPTGPSCSGPCPNPVRVTNNTFSPANQAIATGDSVTFYWNSGGTTHNVTFNDGPASPNQGSGQYQREFGTPGAYPYQCTIHGAGMSGTITVN